MSPPSFDASQFDLFWSPCDCFREHWALRAVMLGTGLLATVKTHDRFHIHFSSKLPSSASTEQDLCRGGRDVIRRCRQCEWRGRCILRSQHPAATQYRQLHQPAGVR